jgi:DNA (cytosine-5)-methyltransferase 1
MYYVFPSPTHGPGRGLPYKTLRTAIWDLKRWPEAEYFDYPFHGHYLTRNRKRPWDEPSYTIVADPHHVPLHPMGRPMRFVAKDEWALQGDKNRRLSWRECAAIQGLPDHIFTTGTTQNKHRIIGNAVPPAVARALIKPIVDIECGRSARTD